MRQLSPPWNTHEETLLKQEFANGLSDDAIALVFEEESKKNPLIAPRTAAAICTRRSPLNLNRGMPTVAKIRTTAGDLGAQLLLLEDHQCRNIKNGIFCKKRVPRKRWESHPYCDVCIVNLVQAKPTNRA